MKIFTHNLKMWWIATLMLLFSTAYALPPETEYLGIIPTNSNSGTNAAQGYHDDYYWGALPIGFTFNFYGNNYTNFYFSSNGLLTFGAGSTTYSNTCIPNTSTPNNMIAAFWDDIVIHATGEIMYNTVGTAPNRKCIVQFNNMSFYASPVLLGTFQIILYETSNKIQVQYRSIVDLSNLRASGNSGTFGIENSGGTSGIQLGCNTSGLIQSEDAFLYTPDGLGSYTVDQNALYDGVLLVAAIPRAGIAELLSPAYNSTVGVDLNFQWNAAANADHYVVRISTNADISSPIHTSASLSTIEYDYSLATNTTYYWQVSTFNSANVETWSEIWKFTTSSNPPLVAIPQTIYLEQGQQRDITLGFTGGDAGSKTATITSLPTQGQLYQYNGGILGAAISSVPTDITDASFRVFYVASGGSGNGAGSFNFHFSDATGTSTDATIAVNVSPPGIPNFLFAAKESDRVEITFDRNMADPTGKHSEFAVKDNGVLVTSNSCSLKAGDPTTIIVYVSPALNTANTITVAYTKGTVLAESGGILESFDFQLAGKMAQVINFAALADKTYGDPDFGLSATASSGLPVTFSTSNATVVAVSGTVANVNNVGQTLIYAYQAGNTVYAPVTYERVQNVIKATATISLTNISQPCTGSPVGLSTSSSPAGLTIKVEYDGGIDIPSALGTYNVVAEIDDANYDGSITGTYTVYDSEAPIANLGSLPDVTGQCSASAVAPTASDACAGTITATTATVFPITSQGTTTVTWTYDDGNGNTSTQTQNIIIDDTNAPLAALAVLPDVTGSCSATASAPTANDACEGAITGITSTVFPITTQGTHTVTWTYADSQGNTSTQTQTIVVDDVTAPVTPTLSAVNGSCSATVSAPTTTDLCAGTITGTTSDPLTYTTQGTHTVHWTFNDGNGNTTTANQTVVIADLTAPVPNMASLPDLTGECYVLAPISPTANDNCGGTITGTTTTIFPTGTGTITWTFNDGNGNISTQTQQIIVDDITAPVASVASLPQVNAECEVTTLTPPQAIDNCTGPVVASTSTVFPIQAQGTTVVTWIYTDASSNISTQQQTVVIDDVTAPIVPTLADLTGECSVTASAPTTSDVCAGVITGTTSDALTYDVQGTHLITWAFDDGNGNISTATQNVIVDDVTAPEIPVLADLTDECGVTANAPTTNDACMGVITGTTADALTYDVQGTHAITWTFDDGNGNVTTATQNVIVDDVTAPEVPVLADVTGECSATATAPSTNDACVGSIIGTTSDALTFDVQGTHVITWSFDDGNGNVSTATQNVIVDDITAPELPILADVTGECSATATAPTTIDACIGTITGTTSDALTYDVQGTYVITWSFDDGNGNVSTATQNVIVDDVTAPVPDLASLPVLYGQCTVDMPAAPTATDNCGSVITGTTSTVFPIGNTIVTWTFDDGNGNVSTQTQEVIVDDTTAPVPNDGSLADVTAECSVDMLTAPIGMDNCAGEVTATPDVSFPITQQGITVVTWTFSDLSSNVSTLTQNVIIEDITAPVPDLAQLDDLVEACEITALTPPTATDQCSGLLSATSDVQLPIVTAGTTVITWTYTDAVGHVLTQTQNAIIQDNEIPTIECPANAIFAATDESQLYITDGDELDMLNFYDNCGIYSMTNNVNSNATLSSQVFAAGIHNITWTVVDMAGNTANCSFEIEVTEFVNVEWISDNSNIAIYPNPASDQLFVNYNSTTQGSIQVRIMDVSGKEVWNRTIDGNSPHMNFQIDVQNFETGVYQLIFETSEGSYNHRWIKSDM